MTDYSRSLVMGDSSFAPNNFVDLKDECFPPVGESKNSSTNHTQTSSFGSIIPGINRYHRLDATEVGIHWYKQFRLNMDGYEEAIRECDQYQVYKEESYERLMKPGYSSGLARAEEQALNNILTKKQRLEARVNQLEHADRQVVGDAVEIILNSFGPDLISRFKTGLYDIEYGDIVDLLDEFVDSFDQPILEQANLVRQSFLSSIDAAIFLRSKFSNKLFKAGAHMSYADDSEKLYRLSCERRALSEKYCRVPNPSHHFFVEIKNRRSIPYP